MKNASNLKHGDHPAASKQMGDKKARCGYLNLAPSLVWKPSGDVRPNPGQRKGSRKEFAERRMGRAKLPVCPVGPKEFEMNTEEKDNYDSFPGFVFTAKRKKKVLEAGQPCRKCGSEVRRCEHAKLPPPQKPGSHYYFAWWFRCTNPRCDTLYMVEAAKRFY